MMNSRSAELAMGRGDFVYRPMSETMPRSFVTMATALFGE
jgi:hypothetical protein